MTNPENTFDISTNTKDEYQHGVYVKIPLTDDLKQHANSSLVEQIEHQNKIIDQYEEREKEHKKAFYAKCMESYEKDKETIKLKKRIAELESQIDESQPQFEHFSDTRHFKNDKGAHPTKEWVSRLWDEIFLYTQKTDEKGNLIVNNNSVIVAMIIVLSDKHSLLYPYDCSNENAAYDWNRNVAERQTDPARKKKLTICGQIIADKKKNIKPIDCWGNEANSNTTKSDFYNTIYNFHMIVRNYTGT